MLANTFDLNQICYIVISQISFFEDYGECKTYGLIAVQETYEKWHVKAEIYDITTDLSDALDIAHTFNHNKLSMIHFNDAVEDWLARNDFYNQST